MQPINIQHGEYLITTDKKLLRPAQIHKWLSEESYWSPGIPFETVKGAFDNSFTIGILHGDEQVGYARLITDYTTFAYLADVYITDAHRGKGLSKTMMQILFDQAWVKKLRRVMLATRDAHELYVKYGFTPLNAPEKIMEVLHTDPYKREQP
jgi:GNAT superfamily N-acetyltransferase